jgi:hypothetical protein
LPNERRDREWTDTVIANLMHAPGSSNVAIRSWPALAS